MGYAMPWIRGPEEQEPRPICKVSSLAESPPNYRTNKKNSLLFGRKAGLTSNFSPASRDQHGNKEQVRAHQAAACRCRLRILSARPPRCDDRGSHHGLVGLVWVASQRRPALQADLVPR